MSFVLDASVALHWCFEHGSPADRRYAACALTRLEDAPAVVPALWSMEVANVLVRFERQGRVSEARSGTFVAMLDTLAIQVDAGRPTQALAETLHLARRFGLSAYDAVYLELAIRTGLPLATLDEGLRNACMQAGVSDL